MRLTRPLFLVSAAVPTAHGRRLLRRYHRCHHRPFPSISAFLHFLPSSSSNALTTTTTTTTTESVNSSSWSSFGKRYPRGSVSRLSHSAPSVRWTLDANDVRCPGNDCDGWEGEELIIKKSRFLGYATHCPSWEEARKILDALRARHPKCRHVCYGYVSIDGVIRSTDDGEPSGTGGSPILNAIRAEDLIDVLCVVVRYYGGIQLGTGGLIRAYGSAARGVLRNSNKVAISSRSSMGIVTRVSNVGILRSIIARRNGTRVSDDTYDEYGNVELIIEHDDADVEGLMMDVLDATRGDVRFL